MLHLLLAWKIGLGFLHEILNVLSRGFLVVRCGDEVALGFPYAEKFLMNMAISGEVSILGP